MRVESFPAWKAGALGLDRGVPLPTYGLMPNPVPRDVAIMYSAQADLGDVIWQACRTPFTANRTEPTQVERNGLRLTDP
jgi:hypothetical protein